MSAALDLPVRGTKAVDLNAPRRDSDATKEGRVKVLLYGRLAESIGRQLQLEAAEGCSVAELRRRLADAHPSAAGHLGRSRALIGGSVVADERRVRGDEEVEFLPPVSGG